MTFLQPSYLWGLFSLLVPIAIHLWSRKKLRTIQVGSTQFFTEKKSSKSNTIHLNEWWLLLLRCLVLSCITLILAKPYWGVRPLQKDIVYIFEPSLLESENDREKFKHIPEEGRLLLAKGLPKWSQNTDTQAFITPNYWQLAQEISTVAADSIVVFTHAFAKSVKGKRPSVASNIKWLVIDENSQIDIPIAAFKRNDSTEISHAQMEAGNLLYYTSRQPNEIQFNESDSFTVRKNGISKTVPLFLDRPVHVSIISDSATTAEVYYLEAAFRAISKYTSRKIDIENFTEFDTTKLSNSDYLITLKEVPFDNLTIPRLRLKLDPVSKKLIEPSHRMLTYNLTKRLNPNVIAEAGFVEQLLEWMQLHGAINDLFKRQDHRTLSENELQTNYIETNIKRKRIVQADLSNFLWILLLIILSLERVVSSIRKQ